jgi:hypothetical protein
VSRRGGCGDGLACRFAVTVCVHYLLVQEDFAVLFACSAHLLEASHTVAVRLWALQETTIAPNGIRDSVLCCAVKLCALLAIAHPAKASH